jgi:hypothetical protein
MKKGRPTAYSDKIAREICDRLAQGESLRSICAAKHMPAESTVRGWVVDDRSGFSAHYARARDIALDSITDQMREDIDATEDVNKARLKLDYWKWYTSKMAPKRYGDRIAMEHTGEDGGPIIIDLTRPDGS